MKMYRLQHNSSADMGPASSKKESTSKIFDYGSNSNDQGKVGGVKLKYGMLIDSKKRRKVYNDDKYIVSQLKKIDSKLSTTYLPSQQQSNSLKSFLKPVK